MPLLLAAAAMLAAPASAFYVRPYVKQTVGSRHYAGSAASVDFGEDWHLKPSFSSYHSDDSSGAYKSYGLRVAHDHGRFGYGAAAGFAPESDGYKNRYVGLDASISWDFEEGDVDRVEDEQQAETEQRPSGRKFGVSRLDLSGSVTQTRHSDKVTLNAKGKPILNRDFLDVSETDVRATAGVEITSLRLELDATKAVYNTDLASIGARAAQITQLAGLSSTIQGFPDVSGTARLESLALPVVVPWTSYTYTKFKVTQPPAAAYDVGLDAVAHGLTVTLSYERLSQKGGSDRSYVSLAGAYRFE